MDEIVATSATLASVCSRRTSLGGTVSRGLSRHWSRREIMGEVLPKQMEGAGKLACVCLRLPCRGSVTLAAGTRRDWVGALAWTCYSEPKGFGPLTFAPSLLKTPSSKTQEALINRRSSDLEAYASFAISASHQVEY